MGLVLIIFWHKRVVWWELAIPLGFTIIFVLIGKFIAVNSLTSDVEWVGGYAQEVRYYEDWNEYIHRTCCHKCGKSTCCYDCSYIKYHPEYWTAETTLGSYSISETRYDKLLAQFRVTKPSFHDMNRHYFSNDGDMLYGKWPGDNLSLEPVTAQEHYENKPRAAHNVFRFDPLDTAEFNLYKPFEYPEITEVYYQKCLLGITDPASEKKLQILNAILGAPKQIRAFILVFKNKPVQAAIAQERYWEGSNKNEIVLCVGVDNTNNVQWAYDFSWTDKQDFKVEVRRFVESQKKLDLPSAIDYLYSEVDTKWKRKDFKDFDYLTIDPTLGQVIWILSLVMLFNGLIGWWIVENDIQ